jgi:hypothetical protein
MYYSNLKWKNGIVTTESHGDDLEGAKETVNNLLHNPKVFSKPVAGWVTFDNRKEQRCCKNNGQSNKPTN